MSSLDNVPIPDTSYYRQWRDNRGLDTECSSETMFVDALAERKVDHFEVSQDANMAGSYIRCFYKLKGSDTLYEDVPLKNPAFKYENGTWKGSGKELWNKQFDGAPSYCRIKFTQKKQKEVKDNTD